MKGLLISSQSRHSKGRTRNLARCKDLQQPQATFDKRQSVTGQLATASSYCFSKSASGEALDTRSPTYQPTADIVAVKITKVGGGRPAINLRRSERRRVSPERAARGGSEVSPGRQRQLRTYSGRMSVEEIVVRAAAETSASRLAVLPLLHYRVFSAFSLRASFPSSCACRDRNLEVSH